MGWRRDRLLCCRAGQRAGPRARLPRAPDACATHSAAESVEGAQREAGGRAGALVLRERTHEEAGGHLRLRAARRRRVVIVQWVAGEAAGRRSDRRSDARAVRLVWRRVRAVALATLQERHGGHLQEVHEADIRVKDSQQRVMGVLGIRSVLEFSIREWVWGVANKGDEPTVRTSESSNGLQICAKKLNK